MPGASKNKPPKPPKAADAQRAPPPVPKIEAVPPVEHTPVDLSPEAVRRAVLKETVQRPRVLYPTAIGALGGLAALLLGPTLVFVLPAALGLGVGVGSWLLDNTLAREKRSAEYLLRLRERISGQRGASLVRLQGNLDALDFEAGLAQLEQFQRKFDAFQALLARKLDPGELTFGRYLTMTEQVFLAGIDNLNRVVDTLQALSTIDLPKLQARIHTLENDSIDSPGQDLELKTLRERLVFHERQRSRLDQWLAENEAAMSQMDHVMAAIADLDTSSGHASMTMEAAMQDLKALAERTPAYSAGR